MHDTLDALNQAVRTCGSVEEWEAAYAQYRDHITYTGDARTVLSNMCLYSSEVSRTPKARRRLGRSVGR